MGDLKSTLLKGLVPGIIMAAISIFTEAVSSELHIKIIASLGGYVVSILVIYLCSLIWNGWIRSHYDLWHIGKIRGLWQDKGLIKQIENNFYSSNNIKVKVTRGVELLNPAQEYGFVKVLSALKDGKGKTHKLPVNMQILLVLPCYQEAHVRERRQAHQDMTHESFLESWYKFLEDIRNYDSQHLSINVRFYFGSHARWRFYIFEKAKENKSTCVLLSEYDQDLGGIEKPMYRIMHGEKNIAGFMCKYFDELWDEASTFSPRDLYEYIQTQKCQSHFCLNCNAQGISECTSCGRKQCQFESTCKDLTEHYKKVLMSFSAGGEI